MKVKAWLVIVPLVLVSVFACVPHAVWAAPTISLLPVTGPPGTKIDISGWDFTVNGDCIISSSPSGLILNPECTVSSGELTGAFTVASGATGLYTVTVMTKDFSNMASKPFWARTWTWTKLTGATPDRPGISVWLSDGMPFMDIVARGTDDRIYWSSLNVTSGHQTSWFSLGGSTPSSPAADGVGSALYFAVRGMDNGIYWKAHGETSWHRLSGATLSGPAISMIHDEGGTRMIVVVRGTDNGIYWCQVTIDPPTYVQGPWHKLSGATNDGPSLFLPYSGGYLYIAVRGMDDGIYWCHVNPMTHAQSAWQRIAGATLDGPAIDYTAHRAWWLLTVAVRGTDNRIYFQNVRMTDNHQPGWNVLPGSTPSGPAMKYTAGVLFFCVRGMDNGIYWTFA